VKISIVCLLVAVISAVPALAQPTVNAGGVLNSYDYTPVLSPGVLASVFGSNLTGTSPTTVTLNGLDCAVIFAFPTQVNIQLPWEAAVGTGSLIVTVDGSSSTPVQVSLTEYSPALEALNAQGTGAGVFFSGANLISSTNPANGGDTISAWATGLGATNPAIAAGEVTPQPPPSYVTRTPSVTLGGMPARVTFSGLLPGAVATDEVNFTVPADVVPGPAVAVVIGIGGDVSNTVTLPVGCQQVNSQVSIKRSELHHGSGEHYAQGIRIENTSTGTLPATGSVILTSLPSTAQLMNGGGATCPSSDGSPYLSFTFTGTPQTATFSIDFTSTTGTITYGVRVLTP
jgi:uncharacterized protein (TIGR03437 family)